MPAANPVALCTQLLPSGKLCRGISLRGQHYCRAHIRNYRLIERERQHDDAMQRLSAKLEAMDTSQLLQTLQLKLDRITSIVRAYPEARLTLAFAIDRLQELNTPKSNIDPQLQLDQIPEDLSQLSPNEISQMCTSILKSIA